MARKIIALQIEQDHERKLTELQDALRANRSEAVRMAIEVAHALYRGDLQKQEAVSHGD